VDRNFGGSEFIRALVGSMHQRDDLFSEPAIDYTRFSGDAGET